MRRLGLVALVVFAGCASASSYRAPTVPVPPSPSDLAQTNNCIEGGQACIDAVVAEMQRRYAALARGCDHRAAFALMYLRVTDGVQAPARGGFRDMSYLHHLDALFARLYFRAFDAYQAGRPTDPAWRIAFDAARSGKTTGIGDMLLGMNAHISNDLPFAVVAAGMKEKHGRSAQPDFDAVNNLLDAVERPMIREESKLLDPSVANSTLPYLGVHGGEVANVIAGWRTEAWQNARALLAAPNALARARVAVRIRAAAAQRAEVIEALASNRLLGGDAKARDTYCQTRGAGA